MQTEIFGLAPGLNQGFGSVPGLNQGFGSVSFSSVDSDLLDTDQPKNTLKIEMSKREFYQQRF